MNSGREAHGRVGGRREDSSVVVVVERTSQWSSLRVVFLELVLAGVGDGGNGGDRLLLHDDEADVSQAQED